MISRNRDNLSLEANWSSVYTRKPCPVTQVKVGHALLFKALIGYSSEQLPFFLWASMGHSITVGFVELIFTLLIYTSVLKISLPAYQDAEARRLMLVLPRNFSLFQNFHYFFYLNQLDGRFFFPFPKGPYRNWISPQLWRNNLVSSIFHRWWYKKHRCVLEF